jgi:hypothetical protein
LPYNNEMSYLEITLPFGIPPAPLTKELVRQMKTPSLASLLDLSSPARITRFDDFSRQLPHEYWLTRHFDNHISSDNTRSDGTDIRKNSPKLSHASMKKFGLLPQEGYWFTLNPVHIHVARDHLVMTDQRRLALDDGEARSLFEAAKTMCEEIGISLIFGDSKTWFLRADAWNSLQTASLDAACGHNMDIWIAKGTHEVAWRKLQNEIQMLWHIHPVNQAREERGDPLVNSVWLHRGSASLQEIFYDLGAKNLSNAIRAISSLKTNQFLLIENLHEASLNSDWGDWLAKINELEQELFAPLLQALVKREIQELRLVLSDAQKLAEFSCKPPQWWKFFAKPSLNNFIALNT